MLLLLVLKFLAVVVRYSSGNAGGIFGPSLFLGAMLGGVVGTFAHMVLPGYVGKPGAYALVGMGTAFAGIVRAPMTSVVMIFEITRDYAVIVPLMISNLLSFFIAARLQRKLSDVVPQFEFPHVHSDHTIAQALDRMAAARMDLLPVVSRANARILEGVVTLRDVLDRYGISS